MRMSHQHRAVAAAVAATVTLAIGGCAGPPAHPHSPGVPVVAVDIGHSPTEPGAISAGGVPEHAYNRKLANDLLTQLHADGYTQSFVIKPTEKGMSLQERAESAVARGASILISVHHDSVQPRYLKQHRVFGRVVGYSEGISGYSLFYSEAGHAGDDSLRLATEIGRQLRAAGLTPSLHHAEDIPGERRELVDESLGIYRYDKLILLRAAGIPSVLFEAGVIVDRDEERQFRDPAYREQIARALSRAVTAFAEASR